MHTSHRAVLGLVLTLVCGGAVAAGPPLAFDEALRLALEQQPQLQRLAAEAAAAEEAAVAERELPDPKLMLGVQNLPVTGSDAWSFSRDDMTMKFVGVSQDFVREEKRRHRADAALAGAEASRLEHEALARQIRRDAALAWIDARSAMRVRDLLRELGADAAAAREAELIRYRSGGGGAADAAALAVTEGRIAARQREADGALAQAQARLARWIGAEANREPAGDFPAVPAPAVAREALERHPLVRMQESRVAAAESELRLADSQRRPDVNVEVGYGQRISRTDMLSVVVAIDLPIDTARRQDRRTAAMARRVEGAQHERADRLRQLEAELAAARADHDSAQRRLDAYAESVLPKARERVALTRAAYGAGAGSIAGVLEAQQMETEVRIETVLLQAERAKARSRIAYFAVEAP